MELLSGKQRRKITGWFVGFIFLFSSTFVNAEKVTFGPNNTSLKKEVNHTIDKGLEFLKKKQNPDGSWSNTEFPAITGLVIHGLLNSKKYAEMKKRPEFIQKGLDFITKYAKKDGGIYHEAMPNYNTSICMMALISSKDPKYHPIIKKARNYLPTLQLDQGKKGKTDGKYDGGIGYGTKDHSDMSNTYIALEALKMSEFLEVEKKAKGAKSLDWEAALQFIQRCQNLKPSNDQKWASNDPKNKGGFVYYPGSSKAGEEKLPDGKTALRSYGSMTYAGLLSLIYADLKKEDKRVQEAYGWLKNNYTLEENPGMGQQGLFYYYHTMAKALSIYDQDHIMTADGKKRDWRKELMIKLINKQKTDGSWINDSARWWENDPALVTAYALITLNMMTPYL